MAICKSPVTMTSVMLVTVEMLESAPRRSSGDITELRSGARASGNARWPERKPLPQSRNPQDKRRQSVRRGAGSVSRHVGRVSAPGPLVREDERGQLAQYLLRHFLRAPRVRHRNNAHGCVWKAGAKAGLGQDGSAAASRQYTQAHRR